MSNLDEISIVNHNSSVCYLNYSKKNAPNRNVFFFCAFQFQLVTMSTNELPTVPPTTAYVSYVI